MRRRHPSEYSARVESQDIRVKAVWSDEERYCIALHHISLGESDLISNASIARALHERHPSRSVESFKKLLTNAKYRAILDSLRLSQETPLGGSQSSAIGGYTPGTDREERESALVPKSSGSHISLVGPTSVDSRAILLDQDRDEETPVEMETFHQPSQSRASLPTKGLTNPGAETHVDSSCPAVLEGPRDTSSSTCTDGKGAISNLSVEAELYDSLCRSVRSQANDLSTVASLCKCSTRTP